MTRKEGTILVVDDNRNILAAAQALLSQHFERVRLTTEPAQIHNLLKEETPDVVLLDMNFEAGVNDGSTGLHWLGEVKRLSPDTEVVVFTAYGDVELAVEAMKRGAADFVTKPWENDKLVASLRTACKLSRSRGEVRRLREVKNEVVGGRARQTGTGFLWGDSPAMAALDEMVRKVAASDANILITGENGTGKEMLAREIHHRSGPRRSGEAFVAVDMGAVPQTLLESELFGHVKGAFTGAVDDRAGKFEVADGGTLFLDEIGNIPLEGQAKLLGALQTREITRVGSNKPIPVDIRLITATNRNLHEAIAAGQFREDLFYRINTIQLEIPPLRSRPEDIVPLAKMFVGQYGAKYGKGNPELTKKAMAALRRAPWPGNVRELSHAIEKAVIVTEGGWIDEGAFAPSTNSAPALHKNAATLPAEATLEEMEAQMIRRAVETHGGNLSAVAESLGVSRQTLYNKMKKLGDGTGSKV